MDFEAWFNEVQNVLRSINMPFDEWQKMWRFDFRGSYRAGAAPHDAAEQANRYWWRAQNRAIGQDCRRSEDCWLHDRHAGKCQFVTSSSARLRGKE